MKRIAILGSTGSIGVQALEVIRLHPAEFSVECLTANNNVDLLISQAKAFLPDCVVIANEQRYQYVVDALASLPIKVYAGADAVAQVVQQGNIDMVLAAMVGYAGLAPTLNALRAGKAVALANKETLVVAGELVVQAAMENRVPLLPVDSEHSAIFQCLVGEPNPIDKIYLTASGGPFLNHSVENLRHVTKQEALKHPHWVMGSKITIDSATMMNKGFEVIEAKWLFDLKPEQIDVLVHPQSIIHSMVQFQDGSIKAQLGKADMKLPISYAFSFPDRLPSTAERLSFKDVSQLSFLEPDRQKFRCLDLAYEAMRAAGNMPCVLNAANEVAVEAFLADRLTFLQLPDVLAYTISKVGYMLHPSLTDYVETDGEARRIAGEFIKNL